MKKFLLLIAFALFLAGNESAAQSRTEEIVIKTSVICDHCAACETCLPLIEQVLLDEKGIRRAQLDVKNQTITVVYSPKKITTERIRSLISKAGYDADEVKADPQGYAQLDGCCKK